MKTGVCAIDFSDLSDVTRNAPIAPETAAKEFRLAGGMAALAALPENHPLGIDELAYYLEVTPRTLHRMRKHFQIPPPVRVAGRCVWFAGRVISYLREEAIRLEGEAQRNAMRLRR